MCLPCPQLWCPSAMHAYKIFRPVGNANYYYTVVSLSFCCTKCPRADHGHDECFFYYSSTPWGSSAVSVRWAPALFLLFALLLLRNKKNTLRASRYGALWQKIKKFTRYRAFFAMADFTCLMALLVFPSKPLPLPLPIAVKPCVG